MAIETIQIAGFVGCSDYTPASLAQGWQDFRASQFYTLGEDIVQLSFGVFYETDILKMEKVNDGNATLSIYIRTNPNDNWVMAGVVSTVSANSFGLLFAIDNSTQRASIFTCVGIPGGYYAIDSRTTFYENDTNDLYYVLTNSMPVPAITSNGGGATHIAKRTGQLKDLSSYTSDILIVSGGGGGGLISGEDDYPGKDAGGISGSGDNSGDQSTGYDFGQGESGESISGGGSGLYGGYKGTLSKSGGAGSGYIGNSLLSNKKMVGYNVPTSSAEGTKTESVNEASETPVANKPKIGNGFARIKFLRDAWGGEEVPILWAGNSNKMTVQISNSSILFKLYTGDSVTYSFTAYTGSTIYDADNIYVGFLIDAEQELAKPSMVYTNGSVLSYNQEEPTDEEMADIYTWLSAGSPSE